MPAPAPVPADDDAVAAGGADVPCARGLAGHECGEFGGETFEVGGRVETDLGVDGEGDEPRALVFRARLHARDVAHDVADGGHQVLGGEAVLRLDGGVRRAAPRITDGSTTKLCARAAMMRSTQPRRWRSSTR